MKNHYEMIIVGAGPSGLSMAHCCSSVCKSTLVIDKEDVIGGCHRVKRLQNGMFTEHSPRMYFNHYVNVFALMKEFGLQKDDVFTKYHADYGKMMSVFSAYSLFIIIIAYIRCLFDSNYGTDISFKEYCEKKNVPQKNIEILDRLCRFSDGATIDKYSVKKFVRVIDPMNMGMLLPKGPLDKILFPKWQTFLENRNVDFALGKSIKHIDYDNDLQKIKGVVLADGQRISCDRLVLAMPPAAISMFLKQHKQIQNCFGNFEAFEEWSEETEYIEYVSMTYHFNKLEKLPIANGLTFDTDWGVLCMNMSDYMQNVDNNDHTVLSVALTICDRPSKVTGKTVHQSTKDEIIKETFRQIKASLYPTLPDDYVGIMNPNMKYSLVENKWDTGDEAYFHTVHTEYIPYESKMIKNLYNVGIHNGHSHLEFTTMESAVSNGMFLSCKLYPQLEGKYTPLKSWKFKDILLIIFIILFVILFVYLLYRYARKA
jgi:hypothetical protein